MNTINTGEIICVHMYNTQTYMSVKLEAYIANMLGIVDINMGIIYLFLWALCAMPQITYCTTDNLVALQIIQ